MEEKIINISKNFSDDVILIVQIRFNEINKSNFVIFRYSALLKNLKFKLTEKKEKLKDFILEIHRYIYSIFDNKLNLKLQFLKELEYSNSFFDIDFELYSKIQKI